MILDELAAHARERVAADKARISLADMKAQAEALPQGDFRFEKALSGKECAFICEVKKASPSKGIIDPVFDFEKIAQSYEQAGADCVSCLTEPKWFLGSDEIFKKVRRIVTKPMIDVYKRQPQIRRESMADGIPAVIKGACVFAHDRVDVFVRQFGWYRRSNRLLSHDTFVS